MGNHGEPEDALYTQYVHSKRALDIENSDWLEKKAIFVNVVETFKPEDFLSFYEKMSGIAQPFRLRNSVRVINCSENPAMSRIVVTGVFANPMKMAEFLNCEQRRELVPKTRPDFVAALKTHVFLGDAAESLYDVAFHEGDLTSQGPPAASPDITSVDVGAPVSERVQQRARPPISRNKTFLIVWMSAVSISLIFQLLIVDRLLVPKANYWRVMTMPLHLLASISVVMLCVFWVAVPLGRKVAGAMVTRLRTTAVGRAYDDFFHPRHFRRSPRPLLFALNWCAAICTLFFVHFVVFETWIAPWVAAFPKFLTIMVKMSLVMSIVFFFWSRVVAYAISTARRILLHT
mmetsp:Transcript_30122/g.75834  ORF Transcript_30122/g.75834 Transcript_30122/m.75834 type:complete len:346 (+) Transcript_30122:115-1152(+)